MGELPVKCKLRLEYALKDTEIWSMHEVKRDGSIIIATRPSGDTWYLDIREYEKVKVVR